MKVVILEKQDEAETFMENHVITLATAVQK